MATKNILIAGVVFACSVCFIYTQAGSEVGTPAPEGLECFDGDYFENVYCTTSNMVIKLFDTGGYWVSKNGAKDRSSKPSEEITVFLGESLKLRERGCQISFKPLPKPIQSYGFLVSEFLDRRSVRLGVTNRECYVFTCGVKERVVVTNSSVVINRADPREAVKTLERLGIMVNIKDFPVQPQGHGGQKNLTRGQTNGIPVGEGSDETADDNAAEGIQ